MPSASRHFVINGFTPADFLCEKSLPGVAGQAVWKNNYFLNILGSMSAVFSDE
jgi:hypothetical protein